MATFTLIFNKLASVGSLAILVAALYIFIQILLAKNTPIIRFLKRYALHGVSIFSASSLLLALVYSEIIGYPPCSLCWIIRIVFLVILLLSLWSLVQKNKKLVLVIIFFSIIGTLVALYATIINYVGFSPIPCGTEVSCLTRYVYEFGFVTIPFMALAVFVLVTLLSFLAKAHKASPTSNS